MLPKQKPTTWPVTRQAVGFCTAQASFEQGSANKKAWLILDFFDKLSYDIYIYRHTLNREIEFRRMCGGSVLFRRQ